jgi:hypothetical protein
LHNVDMEMDIVLTKKTTMIFVYMYSDMVRQLAYTYHGWARIHQATQGPRRAQSPGTRRRPHGHRAGRRAKGRFDQWLGEIIGD